MRKYYEAYDDRYRQVHEKGLEWFSEDASRIVAETMGKYGIVKNSCILELGCGEGRDAKALFEQGYDLIATDVSPEAIRHCKEKLPQFAERFHVLDAVAGQAEERYDFVYAIAVMHMLVEDADRLAFLRFVRDSLCDEGMALLCMLGDGEAERSSDIATAFDTQERQHGATGRSVCIAGTSCRIVSFATLLDELAASGLEVAEHGFTTVEEYAIPGVFPQMMYAVVKRK